MRTNSISATTYSNVKKVESSSKPVEATEQNKVTEQNKDSVEINRNLIPKNYNTKMQELKRTMVFSNSKYSSFQSLVSTIFQTQRKKDLELGIDAEDFIKMSQLGSEFKNVKANTVFNLKFQNNISENSYWSVKNTSERIVDFAKAITENDSTKVNKTIEAFKKGYNQAINKFGGVVPAISQNTYNTVMKEFDKWKAEIEANNEVNNTKTNSVFDEILK